MEQSEARHREDWSLYGWKQSPRQCYKRFDSFMLAHEFKISQYNSCVFASSLLMDHPYTDCYMLMIVDCYQEQKRDHYFEGTSEY
jgi:hypothetical protein